MQLVNGHFTYLSYVLSIPPILHDVNNPKPTKSHPRKNDEYIWDKSKSIKNNVPYPIWAWKGCTMFLMSLRWSWICRNLSRTPTYFSGYRQPARKQTRQKLLCSDTLSKVVARICSYSGRMQKGALRVGFKYQTTHKGLISNYPIWATASLKFGLVGVLAACKYILRPAPWSRLRQERQTGSYQ